MFGCGLDNQGQVHLTSSSTSSSSSSIKDSNRIDDVSQLVPRPIDLPLPIARSSPLHGLSRHPTPQQQNPSSALQWHSFTPIVPANSSNSDTSKSHSTSNILESVKVSAIACGSVHSAALTLDGRLLAWGGFSSLIRVPPAPMSCYEAFLSAASPPPSISTSPVSAAAAGLPPSSRIPRTSAAVDLSALLAAPPKRIACSGSLIIVIV